jgi:hypothetical protein
VKEPDDSEALCRMRATGEAAYTAALTETERELREALDLVEQCAATAPRQLLGEIADQIGRAYSRAMTRLGAREREAVRERVDRS